MSEHVKKAFVHVHEDAHVDEHAQVFGESLVYGRARVGCGAWVSGNARVYGDAEIKEGARVAGCARVYDHGVVDGGAAVHGNARVYSSVPDGFYVECGARLGGNADVSRPSHYLVVGPFSGDGSGDCGFHLTLYRNYDGPLSERWGHQIESSCEDDPIFRVDEFDACAGYEGYAPISVGSVRDAVSALFHARVAEWEREPLTVEDHARWAAR